MYTCPCCGYKTLESEPPGTYDICSICFWEDDGIQYEKPNYSVGANRVSLIEAQRNFINFGACDKNMVQYVREPNDQDHKDVDWKPFDINMIKELKKL